jgi:hypothetical protein
MTTKKRAGNCAWAIPTIAADAPVWLEAEDRAWTCRRASPPRPLESTEVCAECPFWQARPAAVEADDESWADRVEHPLPTDLITHRL